MIQDKPACLAKIKVPAGDTQDSIRVYQQYVCERIAEDLTFDDIGELLAFFHCPIDLLSDRIVEAKLREARPRKVS